MTQHGGGTVLAEGEVKGMRNGGQPSGADGGAEGIVAWIPQREGGPAMP